MPDLDRLMREAAIYCDGPAVPWMTARDIAEAALREQAREIVEALRLEADDLFRRDPKVDGCYLDGFTDAAESVAARFAPKEADPR